MGKPALIVMVSAEISITALRQYFFKEREIFSKPKAKPDSQTED
jgi:hypothetical protein